MCFGTLCHLLSASSSARQHSMRDAQRTNSVWRNEENPNPNNMPAASTEWLCLFDVPWTIILTVNVRYICVAITWVALVGRHGAVDREAISKTLFLASL